MKVIENKYNKKVEKFEKSKIAECENCESKFEYEDSDLEYKQLGLGVVICPCCGEFTYIDGEDLTLTVDNIEFPTHFHHFEPNDKPLETEEIRKYIKRAIKYFRKNKEAFAWTSGTGDLSVSVFRYDGDEDYEVKVAKGYYETNIPFQSEDYNSNYIEEE